MLFAAGLLLLGIVVGACDGPTEPGDGPGVRTIHRTSTSGYETRTRIVVETAGEWAVVWQEVSDTGGTPPVIDFAEERVVVAAMGVQPQIGDRQVRIDSLRPSGEEDLLYITTYSSLSGSSGCRGLDARSTPAHVVAIARSDRALRMVEQEKDCGDAP
jgi:hypothetical protein